VSDTKLNEHGLTRDDVTFLGMVLAVMNESGSYELADISLLRGMSSLPEKAGEPNLDRLKELDFLEQATVARYRYYTVLPAGREFIDLSLKAQPGEGDLGEKTPHKVGVELLRAWLEQREDVAHTEKYYLYDEAEEHDGDNEDEAPIFDVVGFDQDGALTWVGEAETPSNNAQAVINDYEKLSTIDATAVWAVRNLETAQEVVTALRKAEHLPASLSGRATRSLSQLQTEIESLDNPGIGFIRGFQELRNVIEDDH